MSAGRRTSRGAPPGVRTVPERRHRTPPGWCSSATARPRATWAASWGATRGAPGCRPPGGARPRPCGPGSCETGELAGAGALYASVLPRALETARHRRRRASATARRRWRECDLCELHPGEADGLTWDEFRVRYGEPDFDADPDSVVAPGGESWSSFVARASGAVTRAGRGPPRRARRGRVPRRGHRVDASGLLAGGAGRGRLRLPTEHTSLTEWELGRRGLAAGALQRRRPPARHGG